jgi:hypothetical protein
MGVIELGLENVEDCGARCTLRLIEGSCHGVEPHIHCLLVVEGFQCPGEQQTLGIIEVGEGVQFAIGD